MKKVKRPWGNFKILSEGPGYWVKLLKIKPGKRTSLQRHEYRDEVFIMLEPGRQSPKVRIFNRGESHRLENNSTLDDMLVVEIGLGEPMEEDIIRLKDDYGRAEK